MKAMKKRNGWQNLLRVLRNNTGYCRMLNIQQLRRKRICREYKECMCSGYDPEFERSWRKELREMNRPKSSPTLFDTLFP